MKFLSRFVDINLGRRFFDAKNSRVVRHSPTAWDHVLTPPRSETPHRALCEPTNINRRLGRGSIAPLTFDDWYCASSAMTEDSPTRSSCTNLATRKLLDA